jgi:hypothetical protein
MSFPQEIVLKLHVTIKSSQISNPAFSDSRPTPPKTTFSFAKRKKSCKIAPLYSRCTVISIIQSRRSISIPQIYNCTKFTPVMLLRRVSADQKQQLTREGLHRQRMIEIYAKVTGTGLRQQSGSLPSRQESRFDYNRRGCPPG